MEQGLGSSNGFRFEDFGNHRDYVLPSLMFTLENSLERAELVLGNASCFSKEDHGSFLEKIRYVDSKGLSYVIRVADIFGDKNSHDAELSLKAKLTFYKDKIKPAHRSFFYGEFDNGEFIELMVQKDRDDDLGSFIDAVLGYTVWELRGSTIWNEPNFELNLGELISSLNGFCELEINASNYPMLISAYSPYLGEIQ